MKKILFLIAVVFCLVVDASAQSASLKVTIVNSPAASYRIKMPALALRNDHYKMAEVKVMADKQTGRITIPLVKPAFFTLICNENSRDGKRIYYNLYLSPGDHMDFRADFSKTGEDIVVVGNGSNNNQPMVARMPDFDTEKFRGDTLPYRIIAALNQEDKSRKETLKAYIQKYKPTAAFVRDWSYELDYFVPLNYYSFKENTKYGPTSKPYYRNYAAWKNVQDSVFAMAPVNNAPATVAANYCRLVHNFLLREKERIWNDVNNAPATTYKEWYGDEETGKKQFEEDQTNLLQEKIIQRYFPGAAGDYAYAVLLESAISESNPKNLAAIYQRYTSKYPGSRYAPWFGRDIEKIVQRQAQGLTENMIFLANNGHDLNKFEQLLAKFKGKTVLLDMWGTWCSPCREELEKNSAAIKAHFKNKGLEYLYVSNFDGLEKEAEWKKLIAYFALDGTHVLANKVLTDDIMSKTKGSGYPTYIVIKKDGTYELSRAGYPMNRELLIKQISEDL